MRTICLSDRDLTVIFELKSGPISPENDEHVKSLKSCCYWEINYVWDKNTGSVLGLKYVKILKNGKGIYLNHVKAQINW